MSHCWKVLHEGRARPINKQTQRPPISIKHINVSRIVIKCIVFNSRLPHSRESLEKLQVQSPERDFNEKY